MKFIPAGLTCLKIKLKQKTVITVTCKYLDQQTNSKTRNM